MLKKRKKFLSLLFIVLLFSDLVSIHKLKPMAVFISASEVILHTEAAVAFFAAVSFVAKNWQHSAPSSCNTVPAQIEDGALVVPTIPQPSSVQKTIQQPVSMQTQPQPKTYTFKNFSIEDVLTKEMSKQSGKSTPEYKKIAHTFVTNPLSKGTAPINSLLMPVQPYESKDPLSIITGPNFVRANYGNDRHQIYGQITLNPTERHSGPTQQERDEQRALYRYEHNPVYREYIDAQRAQEMRMLIQAAIDSSTFGKMCALKTFFATSLEAPFDYQIKQIRYWLAPLFFHRKDGLLRSTPQSSAKALKPIVEYFKKEYGNSWHQELGKYIDLNEYHLLIDSVNYKGWQWAVNKIYSFFYSTFYLQWLNLAKKVINNPYNQKITALMQVCEQGDFETAQKIVNSLRDKTAQDIFDYFYLKKFDAYGIKRENASDPAWAELSAQAKKEIQKLPNGITFFNNYLALRSQMRKQLEDYEEQQQRTCGNADVKQEPVQQHECLPAVDQVEQTGICGDTQLDVLPEHGICDNKHDEKQPPKTGCNHDTQKLPPINTDSDTSKDPQHDAKKVEGKDSTEIDKELEQILNNDDLTKEHIVEIEKLIQALAKAGKTIPQKLRDRLVEIAIEKEKELLASHENLELTFELAKEEFEVRVARLTMQYGKEIVDEAVSLLNTSEKGLMKNIRTLEKLEEVVKGLYKINSNLRWKKFKFDSAKRGKNMSLENTVSIGTVEEAMAGIACEEQGLLPSLERSSHAGEEFTEAISGKCWDVKTARSHSLTGKAVFNAEKFVEALQIKLKENPQENIILDISRLIQSDLNSIYKKIAKKLAKEELSRMVIVDINNSLNSLTTFELISLFGDK